MRALTCLCRHLQRDWRIFKRGVDEQLPSSLMQLVREIYCHCPCSCSGVCLSARSNTTCFLRGCRAPLDFLYTGRRWPDALSTFRELAFTPTATDLRGTDAKATPMESLPRDVTSSSLSGFTTTFSRSPSLTWTSAFAISSVSRLARPNFIFSCSQCAALVRRVKFKLWLRDVY